METIILISVYLLSVLMTRYICLKFKVISIEAVFICLLPLINLIFIVVFISTFIEERYNLNLDKISDWFFGKK